MKKKALLFTLILMFISTIAYAACDDTDSDCICNDFDNCPNDFNAEQLDADRDGIGDVCDSTPGCGGCGQDLCEESLSAKLEELLTHYYLNILGRAPDSGGLTYWTGVIMSLHSSGSDIKEGFIEFAEFFFNSSEYLDRNRTDEEFITDLYNTFFDRPPDQGGLNYWTGQLSQGMDRNTVLDNFVYSTEFNDFMDELFGLSLCGTIHYDLDSFYVSGGPSGTSEFIDEFDDGIGPGEDSTYVSGGIPSVVAAEKNGVAILDKDGARDVGDEFNYEFILNDNTFDIKEAVGGSIEVRFKLDNGIIPNTGVGLLLFSTENNSEVSEHERLFMFVGSIDTGEITFSLNGEVNDDIDIFEMDIADEISGVTDITLIMDISTENEVTGKLDFNSDGSIDVTGSDTYTLTFMSGISGYAGGFDASFGK